MRNTTNKGLIMKLKAGHLPYISNKIILDLTNSNFINLSSSIEEMSAIAYAILKENIDKELAIEERANELMDENMDEIEFQRADERALFMMIKRQIAEGENFYLRWEDRYNHLAHIILDRLIDEGCFTPKTTDNKLKNLIFKSIDTYAKLYSDIEDEVADKLKNYKRKLIPGSSEYEAIFSRLYEEELIRRGFI